MWSTRVDRVLHVAGVQPMSALSPRARLAAGTLVGLALTACGDDSVGSGASGAPDAATGTLSVPPAASFRPPPPPDGPVSPSTASMAARLEQLARDLDPETNVYQNARRAEARAQRVDADGGVSAAPLMNVLDLGREQLLAGWPDRALATFDVVQRRITEKGSINPQLVGEFERLVILAWLRVGEQQNCLEHHTTESCLMPMAGGGVHGDRTGSERAFELLLARLGADPKDWEARWLLNLAAMTLGRWPADVPDEFVLPPEVFASGHDPGRFVDTAAARGADLVGLAGGVVADDMDGDGDVDLVLSSWGLRDNLRLLRNDGRGHFTDDTSAAGLTGIVGGLNLTHADPDNDGDLDVLVLRGAWFEQDGGHPNSLLRNDGTGVFSDVTAEAGLLSSHPTQAAAFADVNGDGWLELFLGNETGPYETHPCELFWNDGDGTFTEVAARAGLALEGYVKGVAFGDIDDDGDPDLYLSRIDGPNWLMRNDGPASGEALPPAGERDTDGVLRRTAARPFEPWTFTDITATAGVGQPARSFPTWFFDHDQDGDLDLFVSGYRYGSAAHIAKDLLGRKNKGVKARLYENDGGGSFMDVSAAAGLDKVLLTMGCNWGDLDEDGWPDLYLSTGEPDLAGVVPNRMFRNMRDGTFADVTTAGGFGHVQKGHGIAFADFDADGDQDVYAVMGGAYSGDVFPNALFENPGHGKHWLRITLRGTAANAAGLGARVAVTVRELDNLGDEYLRTIHRVVGTGGSFGSNSLALELGLGDALAVEQLRVLWPGSGTRQVVRDVELDSVVEVVER